MGIMAFLPSMRVFSRVPPSTYQYIDYLSLKFTSLVERQNERNWFTPVELRRCHCLSLTWKIGGWDGMIR